MTSQKKQQRVVGAISIFILFLLFGFLSDKASAKNNNHAISSNFGQPGIIDLPSARRFSDGELIVTQQLHKSLARSGLSFQALPRLGFSFRYTGHGIGGGSLRTYKP